MEILKVNIRVCCMIFCKLFHLTDVSIQLYRASRQTVCIEVQTRRLRNKHGKIFYIKKILFYTTTTWPRGDVRHRNFVFQAAQELNYIQPCCPHTCTVHLIVALISCRYLQNIVLQHHPSHSLHLTYYGLVSDHSVVASVLDHRVAHVEQQASILILNH